MNDVVERDTDLTLGAFTLTSNGIEFPLRPPPFEEWQRVFKYVRHVERHVAWWIGDMLIYGEANYGEVFAQAVEVTGLAEGTLRNYRWLASRVPPPCRVESLSLSHHFAVARLEPPDQGEWLAKAQARPGETEPRLSAKELRREIAGSPGDWLETYCQQMLDEGHDAQVVAGHVCVARLVDGRARLKVVSLSEIKGS